MSSRLSAHTSPCVSANKRPEHLSVPVVFPLPNKKVPASESAPRFGPSTVVSVEKKGPHGISSFGRLPSLPYLAMPEKGWSSRKTGGEIARLTLIRLQKSGDPKMLQLAEETSSFRLVSLLFSPFASKEWFFNFYKYFSLFTLQGRKLDLVIFV